MVKDAEEIPGETKFAEHGISLRERQRQARNESILQAAFDLIGEKGYAALTMEDIAERVGISRQTLYLRFPCKEAIALKAVIAFSEKLTQAISDIAPSLRPVDRLRSVVRLLLELRFKADPPAFVKTTPMLRAIKAHPDFGAIKVHPEYRLAFERRLDAIRQIVEAAQSAQEINPSIPSRLIVKMMLGMVSDANYESLVEDGAATPNQIVDTVTDTFLRGIGANLQD